MSEMNEAGKVERMYVKNDTLSTRLDLHERYSTNPYGWMNWVYDQFVLRPGMRVLELACGTGQVWRGRGGALPEGTRVVLSDFSSLMLDKARELLSGEAAFSFQRIDIREIPYGPDTFDTVIANHVFHHVPDIKKALSEVRRVLRPDGVFYSTTFGRESLRELYDVYERFEGRAEFVRPRNAPFTLENGREVLAPFFGSVELRTYPDSLRVTGAEDLVAYVRSANEIPDDVAEEMRGIIAERIARDGALIIRKEQGMFVCGG